MSKVGSAQLVRRGCRGRPVQNSSPSVHWLKTKRMSKAVGSAASIFSISAGPKPWPISDGVVDARGVAERAVADGVGDDLVDLRRAVAERFQRRRDRAVDDLEVAAAGQLLELHQREVGLDAGGVAVHHQADRAGRRDHRRLGVAVAVLLAQLAAPRPRPDCASVDKPLIGAVRVVERHRRDRQPLVARRSRRGRRGGGCGSPAACARRSAHSPGRRRARPPSPPRWRRRRRS